MGPPWCCFGGSQADPSKIRNGVGCRYKSRVRKRTLVPMPASGRGGGLFGVAVGP
jgi:hypothetical protein